MYKRILVCLENSPTDQFIVSHIKQLAKHCAASLLLSHVADGWAARNIKHLELRESEEMRDDREYLERVAADFVTTGLRAEALLATGDPSSEITSAAERSSASPAEASASPPERPAPYWAATSAFSNTVRPRNGLGT